MDKFKVGDRVKSVGGLWGIGKTGTIRSKDVLGCNIDWDDGSTNGKIERYLIKIGDHMSKYDELKSRIENVTAWDKEADDILQEIGTGKSIRIVCRDRGYINIFNANWEVGSSSFFPSETALIKFPFYSQREKLYAFKQALMWLLDHSDIKKDDKKDQIKEIQNQMGELAKKVDELRKEM